jgi:L-fuculose-phosphate aldolase
MAGVSREAAAEGILLCCRRLWEAGLIAGADGNISVRLADQAILVTPRGLPKVDLVPGDLVAVDPEGRHLDGFRRASTELDLHLRVYRQRPDVGAVVHAHPPTATGFALAGESLPPDVLPELVLLMGQVPLVTYATPGTPALGDLVSPHVMGHEALLLANHGAVTWGSDLSLARIRMETLEHAAKIILAARSVGRVNRLTPEQIETLELLRGHPGNG